MSLIAELKRRNVFRVGVAYAIVAWLLVEMASVVLPGLRLPEWALTLLIFLIAAGFPLALIVAWAFELTPEGIKRETAVDPDESITHVTGRKLDFAIIGLLVLAVAYFAVDKFVLEAEPEQASVVREKSIAVLPFDNISPDPEDSYFADGIHDEVLARLSKIRDLKVISRTSVMRYGVKDRPALPEIAAALGVANILEGSVRLAGNRVRITAQLIEAESDAHLWSETYDRSLEDIFEIQSDVAQQIASALKSKLTVDEAARIAAHPTDNLEAYNLFLLGRFHLMKAFESAGTREQIEKGEDYLLQAIEKDPEFVAAYVSLGTVGVAKFFTYLPVSEALKDYRYYRETAYELDPDDPDAIMGMAYVDGPLDGNWDAADQKMERYRELRPNSSETYEDLANWPRPTGERIKLLERAIELDPTVDSYRRGLSRAHMELRQFDRALEVARDAYELRPDNVPNTLLVSDAHFYAGEPEKARQFYNRATGALDTNMTPAAISDLAYAYGRLGREEDARAIITRLEEIESSQYVPPHTMIPAYVGIEDLDKTFYWLDQLAQERAPNMGWTGVSLRGPRYDFLRGDPRVTEFQGKFNPEMLRRMGLIP